MNWVKNNWVSLSASVLAAIALMVSVKACDSSNDVADQVAVEKAERSHTDSLLVANITAVQNKTNEIAGAVNNLNGRVNNLDDRVDNLEERMDSVEYKVDSLTVRVDTLAARQEKCPCINPKAKKQAAVADSTVVKPAQKPARKPTPKPKRDTVVVEVVKPVEPVKPTPVVRDTVTVQQNAQGCGNNQNANVVIGNNSSNNNIIISNVSATPKDTTMNVRVNSSYTVVRRRVYCR